jgi:hypothetical protein
LDWLDLFGFLGIGGVWLAVFMRQLLRDPAFESEHARIFG